MTMKILTAKYDDLMTMKILAMHKIDANSTQRLA